MITQPAGVDAGQRDQQQIGQHHPLRLLETDPESSGQRRQADIGDAAAQRGQQNRQRQAGQRGGRCGRCGNRHDDDSPPRPAPKRRGRQHGLDTGYAAAIAGGRRMVCTE
ncbi:hypothetical protein JOS77_22710 [Chromobacterium haemolyticum]|nr:hypothetical protein JOS77_22710 [Chromobacterium haemolyticum]